MTCEATKIHLGAAAKFWHVAPNYKSTLIFTELVTR